MIVGLRTRCSTKANSNIHNKFNNIKPHVILCLDLPPEHIFNHSHTLSPSLAHHMPEWAMRRKHFKVKTP